MARLPAIEAWEAISRIMAHFRTCLKHLKPFEGVQAAPEAAAGAVGLLRD